MALDKRAVDDLLTRVQREIDSGLLPSCQIALGYGGALEVFETYGDATPETRYVVFSCTKGATALCAHMLASRGKLDLDAPVTELWPEFGQKGKQAVTTRMMLDHSSAVPALRAKVKDTGPYEWDYMTERLAAEEPFWVPGARNGYHGLTFGWTVGVRESGRWPPCPVLARSVLMVTVYGTPD